MTLDLAGMKALGLGIADRGFMDKLLQSSAEVVKWRLRAQQPQLATLSDAGWNTLPEFPRVVPKVCWAKVAKDIHITEQGMLATLTSKPSGQGWASAVAVVAMDAGGDYYAEFTWVAGSRGSRVMFGVADAATDPRTLTGLVSGCFGTARGWMILSADGKLFTNYNGGSTSAIPWASGQEPALKVGETIGLRLRSGGLEVYRNGRSVGTAVKGLTGKLVWAVDLYQQGCSGRLAVKAPP